MEVHIILLACMMISGMGSLVSYQRIEVDMNCSKCGNMNQVTNVNETTVTLQVDPSCGECSLHANLLAEDYMMIVSWSSTPWWYVRDFFYINQTDGFFAFTEPDGTCKLNIYQMEFHANIRIGYFWLIYIQAVEQSNNSSLCHTTDCIFSDNCTSLHKVQQVHVIRYEEVLPEDTFLADFEQLQVPPFLRQSLQVAIEFKERYPECNPECRCSMQSNRLVSHCGNDITTEILVIRQEIDFDIPVYVSSLDVENCGITSITKEAFHGFEDISIIYLSHNPLTQVGADIFQGLGSPYTLDAVELRNCSLSEIPSEIFTNLDFLTHIDLSENLITSVHPDTFSNQERLVSLVIQNNLLSTLPRDLFNGTFLLYLDIRHNQFSELDPNIFKQTPLLDTLLLDHNEFYTLKPGTFSASYSLRKLHLADNKLTEIPPEAFEGLSRVTKLDLSGNNLLSLVPGQFDNLRSVLDIDLSRNSLKKISYGAFAKNFLLTILNMDNNELEYLDMQVFTNISKLSILNVNNNKLKNLTMVRSASWPQNYSNQWPTLGLLLLENNKIDSIDGDIFKEMPALKLLNLQNNPLKRAHKKTFQALSNQTHMFVTEAAICCFAGNADCSSENPEAPYLTCERLLPNVPLQIFMWVIGLFAIVGNLFVLIWRCINHGHENDVQVLLILNLAASDLLMGIYMLIIGGADRFYKDFFPSYADSWRDGPLCKVAGILSILSSEASVFFVTLISIDRILMIKSHGTWQISKKTMITILTSLWLFALVLSIVPTLFSGVEPDFYDVSEVCIGLPFVRTREFVNTTNFVYEYDFNPNLEDFQPFEISFGLLSSGKEAIYYEADHSFEDSHSPGLFYSIVLFLGLNLFCFIIVAFCYCGIFIIFKRSQHQVRNSNLNRQLNLAFRMGLIVLTDFACWMPIVVIGILVQSSALTLRPDIYVYIVVFVLPINSAANPLLYSLATIVSNYKNKQQIQNRARGANNMQMQNRARGANNMQMQNRARGANNIM